MVGVAPPHCASAGKQPVTVPSTIRSCANPQEPLALRMYECEFPSVKSSVLFERIPLFF